MTFNKIKKRDNSPIQKTESAIEQLRAESITLTKLANKLKLPKGKTWGLIQHYKIQTVRAFGVVFIPRQSATCLIHIQKVIEHAKQHGMITQQITTPNFIEKARCVVCGEYPVICSGTKCVCPNNHIFKLDELIKN